MHARFVHRLIIKTITSSKSDQIKEKAMESFLNREIHTFRRGIVRAVKDGQGMLNELKHWHSTSSTSETTEIRFESEGFRFLDIDTHGRRLYFSQRRVPQDGITLIPFRAPVVDDILVFTSRWIEDELIAPMWTYDDYFDQCEDKLPRCIAKTCNGVPVYGKYYCAYHAPREQVLDDEHCYVSTGTVYDRAFNRHFSHELAREAAEKYPGDFM